VKALELSGKRFGKLVAIKQHGERSSRGLIQWLCKCDCGNMTLAVGNKLSNNGVKSCGCLKQESAHKLGLTLNKTHGQSRTVEYKAWQNMITRCYNENSPNYVNYGGRGISVCGRWKNSFEKFLSDMGPKPKDSFSLERINNNRGYSPANCKWASRSEQNSNKRDIPLYEYKGKKYTCRQLCALTGVNPATFKYRIKQGNSIKAALKC
jgi:hypothetical protein